MYCEMITPINDISVILLMFIMIINIRLTNHLLFLKIDSYVNLEQKFKKYLSNLKQFHGKLLQNFADWRK